MSATSPERWRAATTARRSWLLGVALFGCHRVPPATSLAVPALELAPDEVVATVDGRPISRSAVATQAQLAGLSPRQALEELVTAELLYGEAQRRELRLGKDDSEQVRAALVRRLLATGFEREVTPDGIPTKILQKGYASNTTVFFHSEYADVWHILVSVAAKAPATERQAARDRASQILAKARGVKDLAAFQALATSEGPGLRLEHIITARDGWTLKEFSYAAHDIAKPGQVSEVVETAYGFHVIYLVRRIPAEHQTLEQATPRLKPLIFPTWQRQRFLEWTAELSAKHHLEVHAERLRPSVESLHP